MNIIETIKTNCPYCGESIELLVDCSLEYQQYIEDCQVCCRPINLIITIDEAGFPNVVCQHENE